MCTNGGSVVFGMRSACKDLEIFSFVAVVALYREFQCKSVISSTYVAHVWRREAPPIEILLASGGEAPNRGVGGGGGGGLSPRNICRI